MTEEDRAIQRAWDEALSGMSMESLARIHRGIHSELNRRRKVQTLPPGEARR